MEVVNDVRAAAQTAVAEVKKIWGHATNELQDAITTLENRFEELVGLIPTPAEEPTTAEAQPIIGEPIDNGEAVKTDGQPPIEPTPDEEPAA